jgi:hypothetical protein
MLQPDCSYFSFSYPWLSSMPSSGFPNFSPFLSGPLFRPPPLLSLLRLSHHSFTGRPLPCSPHFSLFSWLQLISHISCFPPFCGTGPGLQTPCWRISTLVLMIPRFLSPSLLSSLLFNSLTSPFPYLTAFPFLCWVWGLLYILITLNYYNKYYPKVNLFLWLLPRSLSGQSQLLVSGRGGGPRYFLLIYSKAVLSYDVTYISYIISHLLCVSVSKCISLYTSCSSVNLKELSSS